MQSSLVPRFALALPAASASADATRRPDPCATVAGDVIATGASLPSRVVACMDQFPFNASRDLALLTSVRKSLDTFYPYRFIATSPPDPVNYPASVDVVASLGTLFFNAARRFKTARTFHEAISRTLRTLNDGHTVFSSKCFETFVHVLALPVVAVVEDGAPKLRVVPLTMFPERLVEVAAVYNFTVADYAGAEVLAIDGRDALRAVQAHAMSRVGGYHDPGTRFNAAISRRIFTARSGALSEASVGAFAKRSIYPGVDFSQYLLRRKDAAIPENVMVPWLSFTSRGAPNFTDTQSYWNVNCEPPPRAPVSQTLAREEAARARESVGLEERADRPFDLSLDWEFPAVASRSVRKRRAKVGIPGATALSDENDFWQTFLLQDNETVVITLTRFERGSEDNWKAETLKALALANTYGSRVIFDVRGNGGGLTYLAWWLSQQLMGTKCVPRQEFRTPMDFRVGGSLVHDLIRRDISWYSFRRRADLMQRPVPLSVGSRYYLPLRYLRWNETEGRWFSAQFKTVVAIEDNVEPRLGRRPFLVLTDGTCFSACAIFTHNLKRRYGVRHVTVGGILGRPLAISNSCLGFTLGDVQDKMLMEISANRTLMADSRVPQFMPYRANLTMAFASTYINSSVPCEYVFLPGDAHINFTLDNIDDPVKIWEEASQHFGTGRPSCQL